MCKIYRISFLVIIFSLFFEFAFAQNAINLSGEVLRSRSEISITPKKATFTEGGTFEVPILLNTNGRSMSTIDLYILFDSKKLNIVKVSTEDSIINSWIQPPSYDNTKGSVRIFGSVSDGVISDASLVSSITFLAKSTGLSEVKITDNSTILENDNVRTQAILSSNSGVYTIISKSEEAVAVYSDTHSSQDVWYNNNNPVFNWDFDPKVIGYSYVLDTKPNTFIENKNLTNENTISYLDLKDGIWYFHLKSLKEPNSWSKAMNFMVRIDTKSPDTFKPKVDYVTDGKNKKALASFTTTDNLSGVDYYEVGVIDIKQKDVNVPIFVRTESPYEVPNTYLDGSVVIVRAHDYAGNSTDSQIKIKIPNSFYNWISNNVVSVLSLLLILFVGLFIAHYFWGHKLLRKIKLIFVLLTKNPKNRKEFIEEVDDIRKSR